LRLFLDSGPSLGVLCPQAGPQTPGRASKLFFPLYKELVLFKFEDVTKVEDTFFLFWDHALLQSPSNLKGNSARGGAFKYKDQILKKIYGKCKCQIVAITCI
jgi:hypothetical protein